jgi:hypothetical protein
MLRFGLRFEVDISSNLGSIFDLCADCLQVTKLLKQFSVVTGVKQSALPLQRGPQANHFEFYWFRRKVEKVKLSL